MLDPEKIAEGWVGSMGLKHGGLIHACHAFDDESMQEAFILDGCESLARYTMIATLSATKRRAKLLVESHRDDASTFDRLYLYIDLAIADLEETGKEEK